MERDDVTGRKNLKDECPEIANVLKKTNLKERVGGGDRELMEKKGNRLVKGEVKKKQGKKWSKAEMIEHGQPREVWRAGDKENKVVKTL